MSFTSRRTLFNLSSQMFEERIKWRYITNEMKVKKMDFSSIKNILFLIFLFSSGIKLNIWTICDDLFLFVFYLIILLCSIILEQYWLLYRWRNQTNRGFFFFFSLFFIYFPMKFTRTYGVNLFICKQNICKKLLSNWLPFSFLFYSWLGLQKKSVDFIHIYTCVCLNFFFVHCIIHKWKREQTKWSKWILKK